MSKTHRLRNWVTAVLNEICKCVKGIPTSDEITHPALLALQDLIESDPKVNMLFITMFTEKFDPPQENPIKDYMDMLLKMQTIIMKAPEYNSIIGTVPLNHILIYVTSTPSGKMAFINDKVNKCFKDILDSWAQFLNSPDSRDVLNTKDGWLCPASLATMPDFVKTYKCDPSLPYYGFQSWNDFFARKLKSPDVRPVASPKDPSVISSPCEAHPWVLDRNPKLRDQFWIKAQPYSLQHLLNDDPATEKYVGGTIFQAIIYSTNYHRWHVPVDGTITKAYIKGGAYYANALSIGYDPTGGTNSIRYRNNVNTRAIVFIDTGNPKIGTVAFIAIGLGEISSCPIEGYVGQKVKKGDPFGNFQFGGSSYCLLFQKGVSVTFTAERYPPDQWHDILQKVNSELGTIHLDSER